jgi:hypothetical protein
MIKKIVFIFAVIPISAFAQVKISDANFTFDGESVLFKARVKNETATKINGGLCVRLYDKDEIEVAYGNSQNLILPTKVTESAFGAFDVDARKYEQVTNVKIYFSKDKCYASPKDAFGVVEKMKFIAAKKIKQKKEQDVASQTSSVLTIATALPISIKSLEKHRQKIYQLWTPDAYGKCSNVGVTFMASEVKGHKFDNDTALVVASLISASSLYGEEFISNYGSSGKNALTNMLESYTREYQYSFSKDKFDNHMKECLILLNEVIGKNAAPNNTALTTDATRKAETDATRKAETEATRKAEIEAAKKAEAEAVRNIKESLKDLNRIIKQTEF